MFPPSMGCGFVQLPILGTFLFKKFQSLEKRPESDLPEQFDGREKETFKEGDTFSPLVNVPAIRPANMPEVFKITGTRFSIPLRTLFSIDRLPL